MKRVYEALVNGIREYLQNNGFSKALVGLSGGNIKYHKNSAKSTDITIGMILFFMTFSPLR